MTLGDADGGDGDVRARAARRGASRGAQGAPAPRIARSGRSTRPPTVPTISTPISICMLARPDWRSFALFRGDGWSACRASSASTTQRAGARDRQHLLRRRRCAAPASTGVKDLMLAPRLRLRLPPGRVPGRRPQRAQPGGAGEARRGPRRRAARGPDHLDRPCPRHRPLLDPRRRMAGERLLRPRSARLCRGLALRLRPWPSSISTTPR